MIAVVLIWLGGALGLVRGEDADVGDGAERLKMLEPIVQEAVAELRAEKHLIGLAAMVMQDGEVLVAAADGKRKKGESPNVSTADRWHVGSITKSMTATMLGRLVEQGKISWQTTIADCFPEAVDELHVDWLGVTLEQLVSHTSGAKPNFGADSQRQRPEEGAERMAKRREFVLALLNEPPVHQPGSKFLYSNAGFTIAGVMAEQRTGKAWEQLMRSLVFQPLGLQQAGFGPPQSSDDTLDQPRGHRRLGPFKMAVGQDADNTPIIGPAGTIHMSLRDLCRYGTEHLRGRRGKGRLCEPSTYEFLQRPRLNNYACGWVVPPKTDWASGAILWHNGSNTMWYALLVLVPDANLVIAVTANDGHIAAAEAAAFEIAKRTTRQLQATAADAGR